MSPNMPTKCLTQFGCRLLLVSDKAPKISRRMLRRRSGNKLHTTVYSCLIEAFCV